MPTRINERLCRLAQAGDTAARDILLENNLGFIRKIALEQYRSMGLDENDIGIDLDDLVQEGSIGLLNAIPLFDAGRGMKFLTYAAPAIRNAMTDCIRAGQADCQRTDLSAIPLWLYRWNRASADWRGTPFSSQREPDKEGGGRGDGQPARKAAVVLLIQW